MLSRNTLALFASLFAPLFAGCFNPTGTPVDYCVKNPDTLGCSSGDTDTGGEMPQSCNELYDNCKEQGGNEQYCQDVKQGCQGEGGSSTDQPTTGPLDPTASGTSTGPLDPTASGTTTEPADTGSTNGTTGDCTPTGQTFGDELKLLVDQLPDVYFGCCTAPELQSLEGKLECLGINAPNLDQEVTSCDDLPALLPDEPRRELHIVEEQPKSFKVNVPGLLFTKAQGCGFDAEHPLPGIEIYSQPGNCDPMQPAVQGPVHKVTFVYPGGEKDLDLVNGAVFALDLNLSSPNGVITPFNLGGMGVEVGTACLGFRAEGVLVVNQPPDLEFMPNPGAQPAPEMPTDLN